MPLGHKEDTCRCCYCKTKRGENSGENNCMKRASARAKSSVSHKGVPLNHKAGCVCGVCRAKRGEFSGENNPMKRPEVAKKSGDAKRGRSCPKGSIAKMGKNNPMYGKTGSLHHLFGKDRPDQRKRMLENNPMNNPAIRIKVSKAILALGIKGEKHGMYGKTGELSSNWLGGTSFEPYGFEFNPSLKLLIRKRDSFTCQFCGKAENGKAFSTHHIDYDKLNNSPGNLILLCGSCNAKANFSRDKWQFLFESLQEIRLGRITIDLINEISYNSK